MIIYVCCALVALLLIHQSDGLDNGLGVKPQMGYNSWYDVGCALTESIVRASADAMIANDLRKYGYQYINMDDCWAKGRYSNGTVYADSSAFSSESLAPLAAYIHAKQLLFGVYTDRGTKTCAGRPGSQGYEALDAQTYAAWGVDYVKEDSCNAPSDELTAFKQYSLMRDGLNSTQRPIFFSLCGWNAWYSPMGAAIANSWRIGPDDGDWPQILQNIDINVPLANNAGPGGWNDPCLLISQNNGGSFMITELQSRAQFSMWSIMSSPLLLSMNIRNMTAYNYATYTNALVIAVNQDGFGKQGIRVYGADLTGTKTGSGVNIWSKELVDGSRAFVFINVANTVQNITCNQQCFNNAGLISGVNIEIFDLWQNGKSLGVVPAVTYTVLNVPAHGGSAMYKLVPMF